MVWQARSRGGDPGLNSNVGYPSDKDERTPRMLMFATGGFRPDDLSGDDPPIPESAMVPEAAQDGSGAALGSGPEGVLQDEPARVGTGAGGGGNEATDGSAPLRRPRTLLDWLNHPDPEDRGWSVENSLILGGVGLMIAPTESFKSWAAMRLSRSWLTGEPWMGNEVQQVERVYYVSNEKSIKAVLDRFKHIFAGLGEDVVDRLHIYHNEGIVYGSKHMTELEHEVQNGPDRAVVILDTHMSLFPSGFNENSSTDGSMVLDAFRNLRYGSSERNVLLVGHTPLSDPSRLRGWTGIEGAVDDRIVLRRPSLDENNLTLYMRPKDGTPHSSKWVFDTDSLGFRAGTGKSAATEEAVADVVGDIWVGQNKSTTLKDILDSDAFKGVAKKTVQNKVTEALKSGSIAEWEKRKSDESGRMVATYIPRNVAEYFEREKERAA